MMKQARKDAHSPGASTSSPNTKRTVRITNSSDNRMYNSGSNASNHLNSRLSSNSNDNNNNFLMEDTKSLHDKLFRIKDELRVTQENFISRERAYKLRIEELEEESYRKRQEKTGWMKSDPKICQLKAMQSQILSNVAIVQDRFSRIIQEQEKDLLKAFQARLLDVQAELESQKSKKDDGASAYIELSKAKEYDVEREKVKADQRERQNQALLQSNNRLKSQFASREEDRNYLVMQINSARNDNTRLKMEFAELEKEQARLQEQIKSQSERLNTIPVGASQHSFNRKGLTSAQLLQAQIDAEERYKEVNSRLRKLLVEERRSLQQVRANYNNELEARTELELLLRRTVDEVQKEMDANKAAATIRPHHTAMVKALKLSEQEVREQGKRFRERLLEVLLSKDQVSQLMLQREKVMTANTNNNTTTTRTPDLHHINVSSNVLNSSNSNLLNSNGSSSMAQILEVHSGSSNNPLHDNNYPGNNNNNNSSRSSSKSNNIIIDPSSSSSFSESGVDTSSRK